MVKTLIRREENLNKLVQEAIDNEEILEFLYQEAKNRVPHSGILDEFYRNAVDVVLDSYIIIMKDYQDVTDSYKAKIMAVQDGINWMEKEARDYKKLRRF